MKKIEDECVGCTDMGLYCIGSSCPNRNVARFYCDGCGDETTLYDYNGKELCQDCLLKNFEVIEGSEY